MITLTDQTEALAERLATAHSLTAEEAVRQALEAWTRAVALPAEPRRRRDTSAAAVAKRKASLERIVAEIAAMPILDPRSASEIMDDLDPL